MELCFDKRLHACAALLALAPSMLSPSALSVDFALTDARPSLPVARHCSVASGGRLCSWQRDMTRLAAARARLCMPLVSCKLSSSSVGQMRHYPVSAKRQTSPQNPLLPAADILMLLGGREGQGVHAI